MNRRGAEAPRTVDADAGRR